MSLHVDFYKLQSSHRITTFFSSPKRDRSSHTSDFLYKHFRARFTNTFLFVSSLIKPIDSKTLPFNFQSRLCPLPLRDTVQIKQTGRHVVGERTVWCSNHPEQANPSTCRHKKPQQEQKYYSIRSCSNSHWLSCFDHLDKSPSQSS